MTPHEQMSPEELLAHKIEQSMQNEMHLFPYLKSPGLVGCKYNPSTSMYHIKVANDEIETAQEQAERYYRWLVLGLPIKPQTHKEYWSETLRRST